MENQNSQKKLAEALVERLKQVYPTATCALHYEGDPWRLLVMGRLSAQCTDARVNLVCQDLFARYPSARDMAQAELAEVERLIFSCGLYRTKARDIVAASQKLISEFDGRLPEDMDALLTLPGVGRKIANLLRGDIYGLPAIVADTHCIRISRRMGLVPAKDSSPDKVEKTLKELIAPEEQNDFCHRLVLLGREYCPAKGQDCKRCPLCELCPKIELPTTKKDTA